MEREFRTQRVIPGAIEPESVVVSPQDGELRVYCPCKAPFNIRRIVAAACGLPMSACLLYTSTDVCGWNLGDFSSRGVYVSCGAVQKAAEDARCV